MVPNTILVLFIFRILKLGIIKLRCTDCFLNNIIMFTNTIFIFLYLYFRFSPPSLLLFIFVILLLLPLPPSSGSCSSPLSSCSSFSLFPSACKVFLWRTLKFCKISVFSGRCCWRYRAPRMQHRVVGREVLALSKVCIAFIFWFFDDLNLKVKVLTF